MWSTYHIRSRLSEWSKSKVPRSPTARCSRPTLAEFLLLCVYCSVWRRPWAHRRPLLAQMRKCKPAPRRARDESGLESHLFVPILHHHHSHVYTRKQQNSKIWKHKKMMYSKKTCLPLLFLCFTCVLSLPSLLICPMFAGLFGIWILTRTWDLKSNLTFLLLNTMR